MLLVCQPHRPRPRALRAADLTPGGRDRVLPVAHALLDRPELPAFPILIPVAVAAFAASILVMRRHRTASWARVALSASCCIYGVGLLRSVLFPYPIVLGAARTAGPWNENLQLVPLATVPEDPSGMALNVLLFVPLGILLPLLLRKAAPTRVLAVGFLLSLAIEVTQLVGDLTVSSARIADVDDLIGNTTGTAVGYGIYRLALLIPTIDHLLAAASPSAGHLPPQPLQHEDEEVRRV